MDPAGALGAEQETNWRSGYLTHFRRLVEAGLARRTPRCRLPRDGLGSLHGRMRAVQPDGRGDRAGRPAVGARAGTPSPRSASRAPGSGSRAVAALPGRTAARRWPWPAAWSLGQRRDHRAVVRGRRREVAAHPEWLRLPGRTVAVLGAGCGDRPAGGAAALGRPVAGVDLPSRRCGSACCGRPGPARARCSCRSTGTGRLPLQPAGGDEAIAGRPGSTWSRGPGGRRLAGRPRTARSCSAITSTPTARPTCASARPLDALTLRLQAASDDVALASSPRRRMCSLSRPTRSLSPCGPTRPGPAPSSWPAARCGRCPAAGCSAAPTAGADPGINDSLVAQQGPNYALAKRLQRWRATVAREAGQPSR